MPYDIKKEKCKQSDGDLGTHTQSYTDSKGKKHRSCHTSKKKAIGQIAAIEMRRESDDTVSNNNTMQEQLLKEIVRDLLREVSNLSASEMEKRSNRWEIFLNKIKNGTSFLDVEGNQFKISKTGNDRLISALQAQDSAAYLNAFKLGIKTVPQINITTPNSLVKTQEFGGKAEVVAGSKVKTASASSENESIFADTINQLVKEHGPITVVLGNYQYENIVNAVQTGTMKIEGQTSKADVVMTTSSKTKVGVSIKMKSAEYYLSGDAILAPVVGPIVQHLLKEKAPSPRIVLEDDTYVMHTGPAKLPVRVNFKFEISPNIAQFSVFGAGENSVDIIVKGDLTAEPQMISPGVFSWKVLSYKTLEDLPIDDQPIGLLRAGESGRGFTYEGIKYAGLRPAIASSKRAKAALLVQSQEKDTQKKMSGTDNMTKNRKNESLIYEELTPADRREIEKLARRQAQIEIERAIGSDLGETIRAEVMKTLGSKATREEIADVAESVLKRLHRELASGTGKK